MLRLLFCAVALLLGLPLGAQPYPSQPIRLIAPFPPGGSVDIMARLISDPLAQQLGGKIVIENRSGASGNIGMEAAARSKPDGYTLVLNTIPLATNPALFDKLTWDPVKDFAPIGMVATGGHVLVVPPKVNVSSVQELLQLARSNPGKLSYASAGVGTTFHFCGEMFKDSTGTFILHVPYRGGGPALADTLGGQVDMSFPTISGQAIVQLYRYLFSPMDGQHVDRSEKVEILVLLPFGRLIAGLESALGEECGEAAGLGALQLQEVVEKSRAELLAE